MRKSLPELLRAVAIQFSEKVCLQMWTDDRISESYTYSQLIEEIEKRASQLRKLGIQPGARVALVGPNSTEWVFSFFAILFCEGSAVAVDPRLDGPDCASFIQGTDPQAVLIPPDLFKQIPQTEKLPPCFSLEKNYQSLKAGPLSPGEDEDPSIALICFTSGSTGTPKGILLEHRALLGLIQNAANGGIVSEDRFLAVLPLSHIIGVGTTLLTALGCGCTITFINELKSEIILSALQGTRTTIFIAVPRLLEIFYLKIQDKINALPPLSRKVVSTLASLTSWSQKFGFNPGKLFFSKIHQVFGGELKRFFSGGAPLDPAIWKGMSDLGFTIINGYGLSETASAVTGTALKRPAIGTSGKPFPSAKIKISQEGEVCIQGATLFRGYFRRPGEGFKDGWFHTGDLGHLSPKGDLVITGRLKELIVLPSGQKAIPNEVDRYYAGIEGVEELASFGVPVYPGAASDAIHAAAVLAKGSDLGEVQKRLEKRSAEVPTHLRISTFHFVKELPKTGALKVKRFELRKQFSGEQKPLLAPQNKKTGRLQEIVEKHVRQILNLPAEAFLDEAKGLFELGIDSLLAVELASRLKKETGKQIPPTAAFEHPNIRSLVRYLEGEPKKEALPAASSENSYALVGMACRFPGGANSLEAFWQILREGQDAVSEIPKERWSLEEYYDPDLNQEGKMYCRKGGFLNVPIDQFDASFFGITPREAELMDPQQRLLLEVVWEALENGAIDPTSLQGTRTGVFIGASMHDYADLIVQRAGPEQVNAYWSTGNSSSVSAGRISYFLGLNGPSLAVDTACSSSLTALDLACKSLEKGESSVAIAGGVNLILSPIPTLICCKAKMLSPDGVCKTFDADANGYSRGEGCGIVVLKRLSDAQRDKDRIFAVIHATGVNQDGASGGLTVPNGEAQRALIENTLKAARLEGKDLGYIEAHGTGTSLGDPIEIRSIGLALKGNRSEPLPVGSVKTNIGHLEAAAGAAGLIKTVLSLLKEEVPPHLHLKKLNPLISLDEGLLCIPQQLQKWPRKIDRPRFAGVSSFGFSGTNAHVIVGEAPEEPPKENKTDRPLHLVVLSAKTETALQELASQYQKISAPLPDLAYTSLSGRAHFSHRIALAAATTEELRQKLQEGRYQKASLESGKRKKIGFLFTGQGSQYAGMGKELYETQPVFKKAMDECSRILAPLLNRPLLSLLQSEEIHSTGYSQPALFALEHSLAALWKSWGVEPDCTIGHSVGEYAAAVAKGLLTLEQGLKAIAARARLMEKLPKGGAMLAVLATPETARALTEGLPLDAAAVNGPKQVVLSGAENAIEEAALRFAEKKIQTQRLSVSHAFHSRLMDPILEDFQKALSDLDIKNTAYWVKHLREPVNFYAQMQQADCELFLEIGPHPVLSGMAKQFLPETSICLPSLHRSRSPWTTLLESLAKLYLLGYPIDWKGFDAPYARKKVSLPTYPFQRQRHWADALLLQKPNRKKIFHPLLGSKNIFPKQTAHYEGELTDFFKDHVILNRPIFPASAYLEMIFAAGKDHWQSSALSLENFALFALLELKQAPLLTLTSPLPNDSLQVAIYSENEEHACAQIRPAVARPEPFTPPDCPIEIPVPEFYSRLAAQGLQYGPLFRPIESIRKGKGSARAELRLPAPAGGFLFHPALLDGCFQVFGAAFYGEKVSAIYLPLCIERFDLFETAGSELIVYGKWKIDFENPLPHTLSIDLELLTPEGKTIGQIRGFTVKRIEKPLQDKLLYQPVWQPKPVSLKEPASGPWIIAEKPSWVKRALQEKAAVVPIAELSEPKPVIYCCTTPAELLKLMQKLAQLPGSSLWVLTSGLQPLPERAFTPSPIPGMIKTFALECPSVRTVHLDFDPASTEEEKAEILSLELRSADEDAVAYAGKKRHVCRLLKRNDAARSQSELPLPSARHQLRIPQKGSLQNLKFEPLPSFTLQGTEIAIQVKAAGLNFRDVLNALGLYPGDPGDLGGECAGIVTGVGPEVKHLRAGDEVLGFATGCFASDVVSDERIVIRKPPSLSFAEAAGLPIVFLTAYYSLVHLAQLKPKQKVLIHAATGGVGIAAIQIAQQIGAEVYATAGSPAKREFLKNLGVSHIYDSRNTNFAEQILQECEGVDAVLNSLSSEGFIAKTASCCKKNGVFLEIGKRNIWSKEEMAAARGDLSYFVIALDEMVATQPETIQSLLKEVFSPFPYKPLPITLFPLNQAIPAFQYMQKAKHIGKIIFETHSFAIDPNGSYLITGGTGALGQETAKWLASRGAKHLCLVGRRKIELSLPGVALETVPVDVSSKSAVEGLIRRFGKDLPPLKGIFHAAGILDDALIADQSQERFEKVFAPKVQGAWNLHEATQTLPLDCFVLFSSIASVLGSPGQLNYAAANAALDSLSFHRRKLGLPSLSVSWGPWGGAGMAAGLEKRHQASGIHPLKPQEALEALSTSLALKIPHIAVLDADWKKSPKNLSILASLASPASKNERSPLRLEKGKSEKEIQASVQELVRRIIGLRPDEPLDENRNFYELGLDSLMAVELRALLQESVEKTVPLSPAVVMDHPTIGLLSKHLHELLHNQQKASQTRRGELLISLKKGTPGAPELICLPHAGGGPWIFSRWSLSLPPEIGLRSLQMPGRGPRKSEHPFQSFQQLIASLADELGDRPYALFGHSLGSMVAYALSAEMQRRNKPLPIALFAASLDSPSAHQFTWPNEPLVARLEIEHNQTYGADEAMKEVIQSYHSLLQEDLALASQYRFQPASPLPCPITIFYGKEDGVCSESGIEAWGALSSAPLAKVPLPGNHFDLLTNPQPLFSAITDTLKIDCPK